MCCRHFWRGSQGRPGRICRSENSQTRAPALVPGGRGPFFSCLTRRELEAIGSDGRSGYKSEDIGSPKDPERSEIEGRARASRARIGFVILGLTADQFYDLTFNELLALYQHHRYQQDDRTQILDSLLTVLPWHTAASIWNGLAENPKNFDDMFERRRRDGHPMTHEEFMEFVEKNNIDMV
jgi:hypothetical protein